MFASDTTNLRFDVRVKPHNYIPSSIYHANRQIAATATPVTHFRLISKAFPWTIDIISKNPITCEAVWDALYSALQEPVQDSEWGILVVSDKKARGIIEKAAERRWQAGDDDKRLKRIDWLGEATMFKGLDKIDDFAKLRLLPGSEDCPETWVIRFAA